MRDRAEQASGLRMALEVFRRRRWLALTAFALCLGGAGGLALFLPDIYRARVTVMVDHQLDAQARPGSIDPESVDTRLQTISQEILSRARLGDLIDRFGLYPEVRSKSSAEALIERMRRDIDLDVKSVGQSWGRDATISFVLGYRGRDPIKVAAVANALASFYVEQNLELRERQATRSAAVLKAQLDEMKSRLDEQEARVAEFKTLHAGELPQQVEANLATLQRLNSQLQLNSQNQMRAWDRRDSLAPDPAGSLSTGETGSLAARIASLRRELADLRRRYSDRYPDVIRVRDEIAALEARQAGGTADDGSAAGAPAVHPSREEAPAGDGEMARLKKEEAGLRDMIARFEARVERAPQRQQEFQELSRDYATTHDLYESLLKKYQEARLAEEMEHGGSTEQFRVLDAAIPPNDPVAPNRGFIVAMGVILSIGLAAGAMALREQLDGSFHSVEEVRAFTRVPVLASIPPIVTRRDRRRMRLRACVLALSVLLGMVLSAGASYAIAHRFEQIASLLSRVRG